MGKKRTQAGQILHAKECAVDRELIPLKDWGHKGCFKLEMLLAIQCVNHTFFHCVQGPHKIQMLSSES